MRGQENCRGRVSWVARITSGCSDEGRTIRVRRTSSEKNRPSRWVPLSPATRALYKWTVLSILTFSRRGIVKLQSNTAGHWQTFSNGYLVTFIYIKKILAVLWMTGGLVRISPRWPIDHLYTATLYIHTHIYIVMMHYWVGGAGAGQEQWHGLV